MTVTPNSDGTPRGPRDERPEAGAPSSGLGLGLALDGLLREVEAEAGGRMMASILLLDQTGQYLRHGAAPSLPAAYNVAIDGVAIGPGVGSCGTAAYLGHPVYVTDITSDPLWKDFKDLAAEHGLRACWSTPIHDVDGTILGTFAVYHRAPRSPTSEELAAINLVSKAAATAIVRERDANRN